MKKGMLTTLACLALTATAEGADTPLGPTYDAEAFVEAAPPEDDMQVAGVAPRRPPKGDWEATVGTAIDTGTPSYGAYVGAAVSHKTKSALKIRLQVQLGADALESEDRAASFEAAGSVSKALDAERRFAVLFKPVVSVGDATVLSGVAGLSATSLGKTLMAQAVVAAGASENLTAERLGYIAYLQATIGSRGRLEPSFTARVRTRAPSFDGDVTVDVLAIAAVTVGKLDVSAFAQAPIVDGANVVAGAEIAARF